MYAQFHLRVTEESVRIETLNGKTQFKILISNMTAKWATDKFDKFFQQICEC